MQLMDNTGLSDTELGNAANQVVAACSQRPELSGVRTSYATNTPSVAYTVDREKIKNLGIELSDVFTALQTNFGGSSVNDFTQFGRSYKVIVQADTSYRSQADSLKFHFRQVVVWENGSPRYAADQLHDHRPVVNHPFQRRPQRHHPGQRRQRLQFR